MQSGGIATTFCSTCSRTSLSSLAGDFNINKNTPCIHTSVCKVAIECFFGPSEGDGVYPGVQILQSFVHARFQFCLLVAADRFGQNLWHSPEGH